MLEIGPSTQLILSEDIMLQAIPELDHYYAFNINSGDQFELNHTSHWVLDTIGKGIYYCKLMEKFIQFYNLEVEEARYDLDEAIQFSFENNIIKEL